MHTNIGIEYKVSRQVVQLSKTSLTKINKWLASLIDIDESFEQKFIKIVTKDVKMIKDCAERSIVDFYIETGTELLEDDDTAIDDVFWANLTSKTRSKLAAKYAGNKTFDNNIDIYFNDVKREYILHPMGESEEMAFIPENRDIFIKNNLKLVIDCAKRYQNLGLPFEDLIQIGNMGLLIAFEKFDCNRANLRFDIINDINTCGLTSFDEDEAIALIKRNFKYSKILDSVLKKIPATGFPNTEEFVEWANQNIKKASFSSISFSWIKAIIIMELNKFSKLIKVPKSAQKNGENNVNIIRLDSLNPHTDDCYHDNQISEVANEEFAMEDESMERIERNNMFKELIEKLLTKLSPLDRRIIKKKFGIELPFPMSINEIAENEGISSNKVKYSITSSLKIIAANIPEKDKETIIEMLK